MGRLIFASLVWLPLALTAQRSSISQAAFLGGPAEESSRLGVLIGSSPLGTFPLLRSVSSTAPRLADSSQRRPIFSFVVPELHSTHNSKLPFSLNDGAVWAGRGSSVSLRAGVRAEWGRWRLFVMPEFTYAANDSFAPPNVPPAPVLPSSRNPFSSPWHANGQSIDLPYRFGEEPARKLWPGQTTLAVDFRGATVGVSTENEWWGPGIRNALVLSSNAPGFQHAFVRTARPLRTRIGTFEGRWLVGVLDESAYFDYSESNDSRSISLAAITWSTAADSGLSFGVARSVFAPVTRRRQVLGNALKVFGDIGTPNDKPYLDSTQTAGPDQLFALFFRWVLPEAGFETYAEWARTELPLSFRDFILYPNHTQGYTLGLQWLGQPTWGGGRVRAQAEFTYLEQSSTYRLRDIGSWYTSRAVAQGYTHNGQPLGASIGPGSSSQFLALGYVAPSWRLNAYLNRVRWLEDAHSQQEYPMQGPNTYGWCEHDVSLLPGVQAVASTRFGNVSFDYSSGQRLNVFFENTGPCPIGVGRDIRNKSLSLILAPRLPKLRSVNAR